jgi:hypothetical protein
MVARINIEAQIYQEEQQWVFGNPRAGVYQPRKTQSWRIFKIFQSVSKPDLHFSLRKTPQHDPSVVFIF